MATTNRTSAAKALSFTAAPGLYALATDADQVAIVDHLQTRLDQLAAQLQIIHGDGFESFNLWSEEIRKNYLWSCSMAAEECRELAGLLAGKS